MKLNRVFTSSESFVGCGIQCNAFTLAEVLITLGIIGVVAAMTMPTLINKTNDKANITAMKKAYSILSQATISVANEYPIESWSMTTGQLSAAEEIFNYYKPYLKIVKDCGCANKALGCWSKTPTKTLNGSVYRYGHADGIGDTYCAVRLSDGMNISFDTWIASELGVKYDDEPESHIFFFYVDVNGDKQPNTFGRDVFQFVVKKGKNGVVPAGIGNNSAMCSAGNTSDIAGIDCAAKVLAEDKISY